MFFFRVDLQTRKMKMKMILMSNLTASKASRIKQPLVFTIGF